MTTENTTPLTHSDMIRNTAANLQELLLKVADHIDFLQNHIKELEDKLNATQ